MNPGQCRMIWLAFTSALFSRTTAKNVAFWVVTIVSAMSSTWAADALVEPSAFGMHIQRLIVKDRDGRFSSWPPLRFGGWRLWGTFTSWQDLEPKRGQWNFERLDRYISIAEAKNVDLTLTFGFTPRWASARPDEPCAFGTDGCSAAPTSINDWEHFVRDVVERYKGRIQYYELWNEPRFSDFDPVSKGKRAGFFSGSTLQLVEMAKVAYRVIHQTDPKAKVISPSFDGERKGVAKLDRYLEMGGKDAADIIGFHFYTAFPERIPPLVSEIKAVLRKHGLQSKPLWNTEMGYAFARPYLGIEPAPEYNDYMQTISMDKGAAFLARAYILGIAAGIDRTYWFDWESERRPLQPMGLSDEGGMKINAAGLAYKKIFDWLVDSTKPVCSSGSNEIWICSLRKNSCPAYILWSSRGKQKFSIPKNWSATKIDAIGGELTKNMPPDFVIEIGESPVLVQSNTGCSSEKR